MENVKRKKQNKAKGFEAFFDRYYALFFAPVIVAFLYLFALWNNDVYPFGEEYTAASYDLSAQICPFIEHLFDVFQGKSTLTFSYAIVGGADVTGTFLYFFISPFSFLFLIFGDGKVAHASSIVMLCKLMTISVAGTWFAKKLFNGIPDYLCIAIGVTYTYCGYTFVSNTYINWMDFLIYLPFCAAAFKHYVKTGKFLPFSILVACCIYTCFSIACFSLFTVFPALIAYAMICVEKERRNRFITYLCLSFLVAILMALPVLLPALGAYSVSGRGGGLFDNFWTGFSVSSATGEVNNFNSSTFIEDYTKSVYRKWSYIFSDSIFVVLTLVWLYRKGFKDPLAKFMLVTGVYTLLPLVVDEAMNLMNMGSYMSYALRFGFLNALYFLGGACLCLEVICYKPFCAYDGAPLFAAPGSAPVVVIGNEERVIVECVDEENFEAVEPTETIQPIMPDEKGRYALKDVFHKKNKKPIVWASVFVLLGLLVAGFMAWFIAGDHYKIFLSLFSKDKDQAYKDLGGFSSSFAHSLGGLEVVVAPFVLVAIVAFVGCFLIDSKKISPRLLSYVLIAVVGLQVAFYNNHLVIGNRSTQHVKYGAYEILCDELNSRNEDEYFRVKDHNDKFTACIPFTGNSNSFSVFSSVIDADNFVTFQLFGYMGNGKNSYKSTHNTDKGNRSDEFGDSFLGYKYFIVPTKNKSDVEKKTYVKPVPALDEQGNPVLDSEGKEVQLSYGGYYVYENTIVFPLGYRVSSGDFKFVAPNTNNRTNRKKNQQALYKFLRGEDLVEKTGSQFVTPTSATELSEYLWDKAADVKVEAGKITAKVTAEKGESLFLNFVAVDGYTVTVNGKKAEFVENDLKFLSVNLEEGENEVVFTYSSPYVKYIAVGAAAGLVMLCAVAVVLKKTRWAEVLSPVIAWAGVILAIALAAFFMVYPTGAFLAKVVELLKGYLL